MKTIICKEPGKFEWRQSTPPMPSKGHSIIQVEKIGICGTDIHAFGGTQPYFDYPRILGHELAGTVYDTSSESVLKKGDRVTIIPYHYCGKCIACRKGKTNCCVHMQVFGVHIDGGMRTYVSIPNHLIIKDNGLTLQQLALIEPLAIGAHGISRAHFSLGDFILVIGAGPIGLATMEMANVRGATVIAMDVNANRLRFCKEALNIAHTILANVDDPIDSLRAITKGDMPTAVFDCTGNLNAINSAFQYTAHGGEYILIGLQKGDIHFSHPAFHKRELTLMSSRNATIADFEHVIKCIKKNEIDPEKYITHQFKADDVDQAFKTCANPSSVVIKALIDFSA
ncbi:zinc-binding alcohol dehydrogenase family protein [Olivibacter sp. XZL3]|uniref:zinc-binding alcohol dehydrogenase family protein n=1 Tax=Olivibacter sp. XZL3 TaxID=1735116 RepID=UPI00106596D5|nr:zinc-binding alcohol dehydrogenase family protein [Olivibacter sp. XZL3]